MSFKVSIVEPHLELYGGIRRIVELSNRLSDRGIETTIYHPAGTPCDWMEFRAQVATTAEFSRRAHDVVLYNDPTRRDFGLVRVAQAKLKIFYVLGLYEAPLLTGFHPSLALKKHRRTRYLRRCLRAGDLLLCNSSWMKRWLSENMNLDSILLLGGMADSHF